MPTNSFAIYLVALLSIGTAFYSCDKESENENTSNNIIATDQFVSVEINGNSLQITDGSDNFDNRVGSGGGIISGNNDFLWRELSEYANPTGDSLRFYFIDIFSGEPSAAEKESVVSVGSYDFGFGTDNSITSGTARSGAAIVYITNGKRWSTEYGTQDTANFFQVDSLVVNGNNSSKYIAYGRFSCTLFDINGNSQTFTDGQFSARVIAD